MSEGYRPTPEEMLGKKPKDLEQESRKKVEETGEDIRDVLPASVSERIEDAQNFTKQLLAEAIGVPEFPKERLAEIKTILESIESSVKKSGYQEEIDDKTHKKLLNLVVSIVNGAEQPEAINVESEPEKGWLVSYRSTRDNKPIRRTMTGLEADILSNLEVWTDQHNQLQNIERFRASLEEAVGGSKNKEKEAATASVRRTMYRHYEKHGFTRAQIDDLITLTDNGEMPEMVPNGKEPGVHKLEVMLETWQTYLSDEEKSKYIKLAVGIIGVGAAEGVGPTILRYMLDADTSKSAALIAMAYFGSQAGFGWAKRKLTVEFDGFMNEVVERPGGLNERLAGDLVFQPGERMAETGERGKIIAALSRSQGAFREMLTDMAKSTAPAVAGTATGLGLMLANDWRLGLISLATAPIAVAIAKRAENRIKPIINKSYENQEKTALEIEEQIGAHMEIVLSGMRDSMKDRLAELGRKKGSLSHERVAARASMEFQSGYLLNAAVIGGLTAAGVALKELGVQESGKIVAALIYAGQFRNSFDEIVRSNATLLESCASIAEMEEVFNGFAEEEISADKKRLPASALKNFSIDLEDVSLTLGDKKIVNGVNLSIPAGGVARLEGLSGQGKTTLTKIMAGYYKPNAGEVRIGGTPAEKIRRTGPESLYTHVAYLSQFPYVFDSGNLRENLKFGNAEVGDKEMLDVIKELGLDERFSGPTGVDLGSKVAGLSGGEKTRLGLARAILKVRSQENGGIAFLDEPTEGLDEETEAQIAEVLVRLKNEHPKVTFVIVSHRRSFIEELEKKRKDFDSLKVDRIKIAHGKVV